MSQLLSEPCLQRSAASRVPALGFQGPLRNSSLAFLVGPNETASHQLPRNRLLQDVAVVPERVVEHSSSSVALSENYWHFTQVSGMRTRYSRVREGGGGKHPHPRIHVQVILLAAYVEVVEALGDRMAQVAAHVDPVVHAIVTGVGDPLSPGHELPFGVQPESVAHSAVAAR